MNSDNAKEVVETLHRIEQLLGPVLSTDYLGVIRVYIQTPDPHLVGGAKWTAYAHKNASLMKYSDGRNDSHAVWAQSESLRDVLADIERQAIAIAREVVQNADSRKRELEALIREVADGVKSDSP